MPRSIQNPWLNRFAWFSAIATLALIGLGGMVTSKGAGMSVPDWPNTYGYNMFRFPFSQWVGGIFWEHSHRLMASLVGLLTSIVAIWLWVRETEGNTRKKGVTVIISVLVVMGGLMGVRQMPVFMALASVAFVFIVIGWLRFLRDRSQLRWLGVTALAAVILQGVLGGLRVVLFKDELGIFHATLAQLFFILMSVIALVTSRSWRAALESGQGMVISPFCRRLLLGTTLLILGQLILGAAMRHQHAGLAVPDFPLAYGKIWPATDSATITLINQQRHDVRDFNPVTATQIILHMLHRLGAATLFLAVGLAAWRVRRETGAQSRVSKVALGWFGLICVQAVLGAFTVWSNKAADIATLHVVTGALSLVTGALLTVTIFKFSFAVNPRVIHSRGDISVTPVSQPKTA